MHMYTVTDDEVWLVWCRETFERQKMDIRTMTKEHQANKRALEPKVPDTAHVLMMYIYTYTAEIWIATTVSSPTPLSACCDPPGAIAGVSGNRRTLHGECSGGTQS